MAHVVKDRVQETSTTTGTGTFTLDGAVSGFQTFSSAIGNTNTTYYTIQNGAEWEVGIGTVGAGTLSRDTILESSNAGSAVNFSAGTKQVFCTYPAEKSVDLDTAQTLTNKTISGSSNTLSNIGNSSLTNSSITINGTPVSLGGSASVGTVTSVGVTAGTGISVSGSPVTGSGSITVTNTAPDQTVSLTAGSNISITGTYPSFTIASTAGGSGDVVGPASATDNAIARYDGTTGKLIQDSAVTINDTTGSMTFTGSSARIIAPMSSPNAGTDLRFQTSSTNSSTNLQIVPNGTGSTASVNLINRDDNKGLLRLSTTELAMVTTTTMPITFYTNDTTERLRITSNGGVSFGSSGTAYGTSGQVLTSQGDAPPTWADGVTASSTTTFTNKTISADSNTISGIAASSFVLSNASGNIDGAASQKAIPTGVVVGTTDTQTLTNKTINGAILNDGYTEEVFAISDGTNVNLNPNDGSIQTWTLGANRTPGQSNWNAGQSITLMIDDGTARTITWTTLGVTWETDGGTAPSLATTGFTVIVLWKVGSTIYGARVGNA